MESMKKSLRKITDHMKTQTVIPVEIQELTIGEYQHDSSPTISHGIRGWRMPSGLYTSNLLVRIDTLELRQVDIDDMNGKSNYGLRDMAEGEMHILDWRQERAKYFNELFGYLLQEKGRYERAGVWDFSNDFRAEELINFLDESGDMPELA